MEAPSLASLVNPMQHVPRRRGDQSDLRRFAARAGACSPSEIAGEIDVRAGIAAGTKDDVAGAACSPLCSGGRTRWIFLAATTIAR
jgi:hypothetical protein